MHLPVLGSMILALASSLAAASAALAQPGGTMGGGMGHGMMGHGMMGRGMMMSSARHHQAMMGGIPAPYASMRNPLPITQGTLERGAAVFAQNCASCHGQTGRGDGEAGKSLSPPPANLAWFSQMPMSRWDPFMYWTVAEGGQPFATAMPAFKDALPQNDIWSVISYIQHGLGRSKTRP